MEGALIAMDHGHRIDLEGRAALIVPGWNGSEPAHWQSVWERKYPAFRRVQQSDWQRPSRSQWVHQLGRAIDSASERVVLVAHSLGCLAVAAWAEQASAAAEQIDCALLVAPPDLDEPGPAEPIREFGPAPRKALPFRSLLIGSQNDPYMSLSAAHDLATNWNCGFANAGAVGHINCASGFGEWLQGERYLGRLLQGHRDIAA